MSNDAIPGRPMTAEQINGPQVGKIDFDRSTVPMPVLPKNPVRFAIRGVTDTIEGLKKFVGEQDCDEGLKAFIGFELDKLTSNAAQIDLHDIESHDGGFDLHLSVRARHLGGKAEKVFKRSAECGVRSAE